MRSERGANTVKQGQVIRPLRAYGLARERNSSAVSKALPKICLFDLSASKLPTIEGPVAKPAEKQRGIEDEEEAEKGVPFFKEAEAALPLF